MTSDASARKFARSGGSTRRASTSRRYAPWTNSVVSSELSNGAPPTGGVLTRATRHTPEGRADRGVFVPRAPLRKNPDVIRKDDPSFPIDGRATIPAHQLRQAR